jgi:hypothetical protein
MILRQFLYLNESLVDEFLAQVEGGLFDSEDEREGSGGGRNLGAGASAGPVRAEAASHRNTDQSRQRVVRQTPESRFDRLHVALSEAEMVQPMQAVDKAIWSQLRRGEILEIEAVTRLSGTATLFRMTEQVTALLPLMDLFGGEVDSEARENIEKLAEFMKLSGGSASVPIIAELVDSPDYQFVCHLESRSLRVAADAIEGEVTILGKIQRLLAEKETLAAGDLMPGIGMFPRAERRKLEKSLSGFKSGETRVGDFAVRYPAALLTAVAVYR